MSIIWKQIILLIFLLLVKPHQIQAQQESSSRSLDIETYDGLHLPARVILSEDSPDYLVVFIGGSTPYNERGYQATMWSNTGQPLLESQDFYLRFSEILPLKAYDLAMIAKRSFVYPDSLPRPSLDDLALDNLLLVRELREQKILTTDRKLVLVGYSEGSIVGAKLLGLMKHPPAYGIFLGSVSLAFDYENKSWHEWYRTDVFKRLRGWSDERIREEFRKTAELQNVIRVIDEGTWENKYKRAEDGNLSVAPWESLHINREVGFYDPVSDILTANIPVLILIGENDEAMPKILAERTYRHLVENGFNKATLRVIPNETHQYRQYDVFAIMDRWIRTDGKSTEVVLDSLDRHIIQDIEQRNNLKYRIDSLGYEDSKTETLECFNLAKQNKLEEFQAWFKLGVGLAGYGKLEEAAYSFEKSISPDNVIQYASMVWLGHIHDLQSRREQAITFYEQALDHYPGFAVQHDQWGLKLDRQWIIRKIDTPFVFPDY